MKNKLTSNDIARIAGVSQTTVSLVLRGKSEGRVSDAVAKRVIQIAEENNYRVNRAASMLKSGRSRNIALVVPDSENPFYSHMLHNLRKSASEKGYNCILIETDNAPHWYGYIENAILGNEIDIAVVCYTSLPKRNEEIEKRLIFINDMPVDFNSVSINFSASIAEAVKIFRRKGYKQVIHGRTDFVKETFTNRQNAYYKACSEHGYMPTEVVCTGLTYNNMFENLEKVADSIIFPSAFILDDDLLAPGVYAFAMRHEYEIGKDIGIIGLDNIFICGNFFPKLSSFGYDIEQLISCIWKMIENIHNEKAPDHVSIPLKLNDGTSY